MLVLSRREGESIVIAPGTPYECRITFIGGQDEGRKAKLGFEAARSVRIWRSELLPKESCDDRNNPG